MPTQYKNLLDEFPASKELIEKLIANDPSFSNLLKEYETLSRANESLKNFNNHDKSYEHNALQQKMTELRNNLMTAVRNAQAA